MKIKHLVCVGIMLFVAVGFNSVQAQKKNDFKTDFSMGVGSGMTFHNVDFVPRILQTNKKGVFGGVAFRYISEKHWGIQTELNFSNRGWQEDWTQTDSTFAYSRSLNYLEMPVLTHLYFGKNKRFFVNIGPQFSYLINESHDMNEPLTAYIKKQKEDVPDNPEIGAQYESIQKKFEYGIVGGMGFELRTGIGIFDLEGRYYFGLSDIFNNRKADTFSRSAHRIIEAKISYFFPLFK